MLCGSRRQVTCEPVLPNPPSLDNMLHFTGLAVGRYLPFSSFRAYSSADLLACSVPLSVRAVLKLCQTSGISSYLPAPSSLRRDPPFAIVRNMPSLNSSIPPTRTGNSPLVISYTDVSPPHSPRCDCTRCRATSFSDSSTHEVRGMERRWTERSLSSGYTPALPTTSSSLPIDHRNHSQVPDRSRRDIYAVTAEQLKPSMFCPVDHLDLASPVPRRSGSPEREEPTGPQLFEEGFPLNLMFTDFAMQMMASGESLDEVLEEFERVNSFGEVSSPRVPESGTVLANVE